MSFFSTLLGGGSNINQPKKYLETTKKPKKQPKPFCHKLLHTSGLCKKCNKVFQCNRTIGCGLPSKSVKEQTKENNGMFVCELCQRTVVCQCSTNLIDTLISDNDEVEPTLEE